MGLGEWRHQHINAIHVRKLGLASVYQFQRRLDLFKHERYKFHVGVGSNIYYNTSSESIGILCEIAASSLTTGQINILSQTSTQAYTSTGFELKNVFF